MSNPYSVEQREKFIWTIGNITVLPKKSMAEGGPGSGNWGHEGRPGEIGGSGEGGGYATEMTGKDREIVENGIHTSREFSAVGAEAAAIYNMISNEKSPGEMKGIVVEQLSIHTGIDEARVNDYVKAWAQTSNDNHPLSLRNQVVAADLLDSPLSEWQQEKAEMLLVSNEDFIADLNEVYELEKVYLDTREREGYADEQFDKWATATDNLIAKYGIEQDNYPNYVGLMKYSTGDLGKLVNETYGATQDSLAELGLNPDDEVYLFRGIDDPTLKDISEVEEITYKGNAIESWSTSANVASHFAFPSGSVIAAKFKISEIFSTCYSGIGCKNELEVVVKGGRSRKAYAYDKEYYEDIKNGWKKAYKFSEGGPGSGNWGHEGRPGEIGGSGEGGGFATEMTNADRATAERMLSRGLNCGNAAGNRIGLQISGTPETTEELKDKVVTNLSNITGVNYEKCNNLVATWANTSNDNNKLSLAVQQTASDILDSPLSDWQEDKISGTLIRDREFLADAKEMNNATLAFINGDMSEDEYIAIASKFDADYDNERAADYQSLAEYDEGEIDSIVSAVYEQTQADLAEMGFKPDDEVVLFRGMYDENLESINDVEEITYRGNAIESWSARGSVAQQFAAMSWTANDTEDAYVIAAKFKISDIYSTPRTGIGCQNEYEVVVKGSWARKAYSYKSQYFKAVRSGWVKPYKLED